MASLASENLKSFVHNHVIIAENTENIDDALVSDMWIEKVVFQKGHKPKTLDEREQMRKELYRLYMKIPGMRRMKEISLYGLSKELGDDLKSAYLAFGLGELLDLYTIIHPKKGMPNISDKDAEGLARYGFISFIMDEELEELDEWYDKYN